MAYEIVKPKRTPYPPTGKELEKQIREFYRDAWEETRALIAEIHERYTAGEVLTRTDMVKYNRLSKTELELARILTGLYRKNRKYLYDSFEQAYLFGHFSQVYELEMKSDTLLGFGGVNRRAIEQALAVSLTGLTLNERLKKNEREVVYRVRQELSQSLVQGESYPTAAKRLRGVFEGDEVKAMRVAATELHRAQEEAADQTREKARERVEFTEVWLATLDQRTRDTHQAMDGQEKGDDGFFDVAGYAARFPGDPALPAKECINCRCTTVVEIPGRPVLSRRGRISLDEDEVKNNQLFPADMTYPQWYESRMT